MSMSGAFGRQARRGVWMGMTRPEMVLSFSTAGVATLLAMNIPMPWGLVVPVILMVAVAAVIIPRPRGDTIQAWVARLLRHGLREISGQNEWVYSPAEAEEMKKRGAEATPETFWLSVPGPGQAVQLYDMNPGALVYNAHARQVSFTVAVNARAFALEDTVGQNQRVTAWGALLAGLCSHPGVVAVQVLDKTHIRPPSAILEAVEDARAGSTWEPKDRFTMGEYERLIREASRSAVHEQFLRITLSLTELHTEIRSLGGGIGGAIRAAQTEMNSLPADLQNAGAQFDRVVSVREMAGLVRTAFDPGSAATIERRRGDFAGAAPASAGPMVARRRWNRFESDGYVHEAHLVTEWPRRPVVAGFIEPLIFAGDFIHTVSLTAVPRSPGKALKELDRARHDLESTADLQARLKVRASAQQRAQMTDLAERERDLLDGHGEVHFFGAVTISAKTEADLARARSEMRHAAARALTELRIAGGQQYEAFLAAATTLGVGL